MVACFNLKGSLKFCQKLLELQRFTELSVRADSVSAARCTYATWRPLHGHPEP